jgi:hypothetical protein
MRIFDSAEGRFSHKAINFVDENNVLVGFDMSQDCCESFGWYIRTEPTPYVRDLSNTENSPPNIEAYNFDPEYCEEIESSSLDAGGEVVFRLTADNLPDLFLHLYNSHNGYYSHGFTVSIGGEVVKSDRL